MLRLTSSVCQNQNSPSQNPEISFETCSNAIKAVAPCLPDRELDASTPGQLCVDTVALCGGEMSGNFMWVTTVTDALTQWTECRPAWNRGAYETGLSLDHAFTALPFAPQGIHSDSGSEFLNHHVYRFIIEKGYVFTRSRPYHKNDNDRVEQKNASIVRELFGEIRIDCFELKGDLERLCEAWSLYTNLFRPCKRLISREKKVDGKGFSKRYDRAQTPFERVKSSGVFLPEAIERLEIILKTANLFTLRREIERALRRLYRTQRTARESGSGLAGIPAHPNRSHGKEKKRSVQQLRNQRCSKKP